jgi:transcriptional regulator with XRE-family HTH domain
MRADGSASDPDRTQVRGSGNPDWLKKQRRAAGRRLTSERAARGLSQWKLARAAKLSLITVGRLERGESGSERSYREIARALAWPSDWFLKPDGLSAERTELTETGPVVARLIAILTALASEDRDAAETQATWLLEGLGWRLGRDLEDVRLGGG